MGKFLLARPFYRKTDPFFDVRVNSAFVGLSVGHGHDPRERRVRRRRRRRPGADLMKLSFGCKLFYQFIFI
jgi:hypothetical protein